jgi:hypothetical protein
MRQIGGHLLVLEYRGLHATDVDSAWRTLADARAPVRVGLIASDHGLPAPGPALREIHTAAGRELTWAVFGPRPAETDAKELREAGVAFVLAEPFNEEELRFVLNEAHHVGSRSSPRKDARVPVSFRARVVTKTGERVALVCNLSEVGAYLSTPRPALRGGTIDLFLPLDDGEVSLRAQVMWNNVPGNLRRTQAAIGMGVRFLDVPAETAARLARFRAALRRSYEL